MEIRQITVIGTGLIGGSFALAARKHGFKGRIIGCDSALVLAQGRALGVFDIGMEDPRQAAHGSDLIVLATPVGGIIDLLGTAPVFPPQALITDVGSTKLEIVSRAHSVLGEAAKTRFLAGHPMAGKEHGGVFNADPGLFLDTVWLVTPLPEQDIHQGLAGLFLELVGKMGARVISMDAERHDRFCAWVSQLPQMISTALAVSLQDEFGDAPDLHAIGGRALREMTRIASSPYSMWRDIALSNTANIQEALLRMEQELAHIRENLCTRGLEAEFERAGGFRKMRGTR